MKSIWMTVLYKLVKNRLALFCMFILSLYIILAVLAYTNIIANDWNVQLMPSYSAPSLKSIKLWFGTDIFGRSVLLKVIKGTEVSMGIGLVVCITSLFIGVTLGCLAGYFGGLIDEATNWLYSIVSSIPNIMLLISFVFILGRGILAVYLSLGMISWGNIYKLVRAEVIKNKNSDYVQAATAIGASNFRKLFIHILPNISHIIVIQASLIFQSAIKYEVVLSYLGLGVQGIPSWGIMIDEAKLELVRNIWWQLTFATLAMFGVVLVFNILNDAFRDALDPKFNNK
jgi:ABC-type dipeptide/oligopeptide/nickel transport system permease subunit